MLRKSVLNLMTLAGLTAVSGCAGDRMTAAWDRTTSFFTPKSAEEEISPEFREAQKTFKKNTEKTLLAWARYQEDVGEYAEARKKYREIEIAYPNNIEASLGIARVELATGRSEEAEKILKGLASRHPDSVPVRIELGTLYASQENWDQAIEAYTEACDLAPEDQGCRYELGVAYAKSGNLDQAYPHLKYAVGGPAAYYNIGYLLHEQGDDEASAEWLRKALTSHPDQKTSESARSLLAIVDPTTLNIDGHNRNSAIANSSLRQGASTPAIGEGQFDESGFVEEELPQVVAGRARVSDFESAQDSGSRAAMHEKFVPSAVPSKAVSTQSASPAEPPSAFRTVSHRTESERRVQSLPVESIPVEEEHDRSNPPQWHGPRRATTPEAAPVSPPASETVDPPAWRRRRI